MTRVQPAALPDRRIIVFASAENCWPALFKHRVDAVMMSLQMIRTASHAMPSWDKWRPEFDTYPQWRYLDSGAFTFLRRNRKLGDRAVVRKNIKKGNHVGEAELSKLLRDYLDFLDKREQEFDFIIEVDVHPMTIERADGRIQTGFAWAERVRTMMGERFGSKLLPVWHWSVDDPPYPYFKTMLDKYPYIAIPAQEVKLIRPAARAELNRLCAMAHSAGVKVHLLGTTREEILQRAAVDTADSTAWVAAGRFGKISRSEHLTYRERRPRATATGVSWPSVRRQSRDRGVRTRVAAEGFDPEVVAGTGPGLEMRYDLSVAAEMDVQRNLRTIEEIEQQVGGLLW